MRRPKPARKAGRPRRRRGGTQEGKGSKTTKRRKPAGHCRRRSPARSIGRTKTSTSNQPNRNNNMKSNFAIGSMRLVAVLLLMTLGGMSARAGQPPAVNDNIYNYLQLLRSDVNSAKVELLNGIM